MSRYGDQLWLFPTLHGFVDEDVVVTIIIRIIRVFIISVLPGVGVLPALGAEALCFAVVYLNGRGLEAVP